MSTKPIVDGEVSQSREPASQKETFASAGTSSAKVLCIVSMYLPETGATGRRTHSMVNALAQKGYELQLITQIPHYPKRVIFPEYRGKFFCNETYPYGRVARIRPLIFKKQSFVWRSVSEIWFAFWASFVGIAGKKPDFVFATTPSMFTLFAARLVATLRGSALIVEFRDLTWLYASALSPAMKRASSLLEKQLLRVARSAQGVFCANESIRQYLVERGVRAETCLTISNGVDKTLLAQQEVAHSEQTGFHAMYVGLLGHPQGLSILVEAARLLQEDPRYQITLVGDGPEMKDLQALANKHELKNIHFAGNVPPEQLGTWYKQADILIVHLRPEPEFDHALPSKVFEYMAAKKPLIFAGNGPGADVVREADAGLVISPGQINKMVDAIRYLATHPDSALKYGQNGYHHVVTYYRREVLLERLVTFFDTLNFELGRAKRR